MSVTAPGGIQTLPTDWTRLVNSTPSAGTNRFALYHVSDNNYAVVYDDPSPDTPAYRVPDMHTVELTRETVKPVEWDEIEANASREFTTDEKHAVDEAVTTLIIENLSPVLDPDTDTPDSVRVVALSDWFFAVQYSQDRLRELLNNELSETDELTADRAGELLDEWAGEFLCGIDFEPR